jgi:hypothetical protein
MFCWINRRFIYRSCSPEHIAAAYPTITIEQVYAAILYYHHNRQEVENYLSEWFEFGRKMREKQECDLPHDIIRLRQLKAEREAKRGRDGIFCCHSG